MATPAIWRPQSIGREPAFYRRRKKRDPGLLGQILLHHGDIDPQLLRRALKLQEERGGQLGRILVGSGACSEASLARALLEQLRRSSEEGRVSSSIAARENPALAGLRVATSPRLTVAVLVLTDIMALVVAALVGHAVELARTGTLAVATLPLLGLAVGVCLATLRMLGLYGAMAPSPPDEIRNAAAATTLALSCVGAVTLLHGGSHAWSMPLVAATWASALLLVPLARALARSMFAPRSWWGTPVVVLGAGKAGRLVVRTLRANPRCGLKPVMMLDDDRTKQGTLRADLRDHALELHSVNQSAAELATPSIRAMSAAVLGDDEISSVRPRPDPRPRERARGMFAEVEGVPVVGDLALAPVLAAGLRVPYAIVAMPGLGSEKLAALVERVGGVFSHLLVIPDLFGLASLGVPARDVDGILGLEVRQQLLLPGPRLAKRVMDVALVVVGGLCILPVLFLLACLIKLDSRGPVLYPQDRLGRDGRRFRALKFRSMHGDGEQRLRAVLDADPRLAAEYREFHKLSHDPRVTRVGRILRKYSLDELPQLWNVLTGDMSLVGPRPYLEREIPQMEHRETVILRALPGMTGLWQVGDRNATAFDARIATDVHYVRNWSPWLDVWVLARTLGVVVRGTGS
jgi:lipopolysaccharide/colanic/teichoic acid biosynthesis glycosyltransferase